MIERQEMSGESALSASNPSLRRWLGRRIARLAVLVYALADRIAGEDTLAEYAAELEVAV